VLDLNKVVEHFLEIAVSDCEDEGARIDDPVLSALDDPNLSAEAKARAIIKWLHDYRVLRGIPKGDHDGLTRGILNFADNRGGRGNPISEAEILNQFNILHGQVASGVSLAKSGRPRSLPSLTSKVLWCFYPHAIPIYDSNALRALHVIARLMDWPAPTCDSAYGRFVEVWFRAYRHVERTIPDDAYRFKVRVLDRVLWIIGQPEFRRD
jgi:hypothetical protein